MNTQALKLNLINAIGQSSDSKLLLGISRLMDLSDREEKLIRFSNKQNDQIDEAIRQVENGEFLTDEEAQKEVDQWLVLQVVNS